MLGWNQRGSYGVAMSASDEVANACVGGPMSQWEGEEARASHLDATPSSVAFQATSRRDEGHDDYDESTRLATRHVGPDLSRSFTFTRAVTKAGSRLATVHLSHGEFAARKRFCLLPCPWCSSVATLRLIPLATARLIPSPPATYTALPFNNTPSLGSPQGRTRERCAAIRVNTATSRCKRPSSTALDTVLSLPHTTVTDYHQPFNSTTFDSP